MDSVAALESYQAGQSFLVRTFPSTQLPAGAPAGFIRYDVHSFTLRVINTSDTAQSMKHRQNNFNLTCKQFFSTFLLDLLLTFRIRSDVTLAA